MYRFVCFFFFFSSRRRHTRLVSDWSSDVCSSDLKAQLTLSPQPSEAELFDYLRKNPESNGGGRGGHESGSMEAGMASRSEERRVGKECRSRWERDHEKKKEHNTRRRVSQ